MLTFKKICFKLWEFILLPACISYALQVLVFCSIAKKAPYISSDNFIGEIFLFVVLFFCAKTKSKALIFYSVILTVLYFSNAVKYLYLGSPVLMSDLFMFSESFEALPYVLKFVIVFLIAVPISVGVWACSFKQKSTYISFLVVFALFFALNVSPVQFEKYFFPVLRLKKVNWNQYLSFKRKGPILFLFTDYLEHKSNQVSVVSDKELEEVSEYLNLDSDVPQEVKKENIFIIVLESYLDSKSILGTTVDPYDFIRVNQKKLKWKEMLSPRFGNGTATAEFEILCGFPYYKSLPAFFHDSFKNIECLPELANEAGYHTNAYHPNRSSFFNRDEGYPGLGFQTSFFLKEIDPSNTPRSSYMLDDELFRRLKVTMPKNSKKQLHYILTAGLHSPYNQEIVTKEDQKLFTKKITENAQKYYVRQLQTSKSLSDFLDDILSKDPQAKIFLTTDHAPPLQDVYQGVSTEQKYLVRYTTINIDLDLPSKVSSYELGANLKKAFGFKNRYHSILHLQASKNIILRPLEGDVLIYDRITGKPLENNQKDMKILDTLFRYYWKGEKQVSD